MATTKILVIDTDTNTFNSLQPNFRLNAPPGWTFEWSYFNKEDLEEILARIKAASPDIILLGNRFPTDPDFGIKTVLPEIQSEFGYKLPVIILTAYRGKGFEQVREAYDYGASDFVDKQNMFQDRHLLTTLIKVLDESQNEGD